MTLAKVTAAAVLIVGSAFGEGQPTGNLVVKFGTAMEVEGVGVFKKNDTFTPTAVPCLYRMRPVLTEGQRAFCIRGTDKLHDTNLFRFPMYGEGDWSRVALSGTDTNWTFNAYIATDIRYADAERGSNAWDGTTDYEHRDETANRGPKLSLQEACDVATGSYPIVYAAPGFYTNDVKTASSSGYECRRRLWVSKNIAIIATEGPDKTFIVGAPDPETGGCGANAIAGVLLNSGGFVSCLQGFTVTGCYAPADQVKYIQMGAALCAGSYSVYWLDCVVSNNFANSCPAAYYGHAVRTRFLRNSTIKNDFLMRFLICDSCILAGNNVNSSVPMTTNANLTRDVDFYSCTADLLSASNPTGIAALFVSSTGKIVNGLVRGNRVKPTADWIDTVATSNPLFADPAADDFRVAMLSPAVEANDYAAMDEVAKRLLASDVDGRYPTLVNGRMRAGAVWNEPPVAASVIEDETGKVATNAVPRATTVTVTATKTQSRPFLGFEINGELQPPTSTSMEVSLSAEAGAVTTVRTVYGTDWYVDQASGDDSHFGSTPATAKATIRAATTNAVSGDVVHVAKGTYGDAEGTQSHSQWGKLMSRVIVPAGVTLVSDDPDGAIIVGAASAEPDDDLGNGPGAIRCVYLESRATIRGFVLTGGHTYGEYGAAGLESDRRGAAALGKDLTSIVECCVVSNNMSAFGSLSGTRNVKCRIFHNTANLGAAGYACSWYGCVIDHMKCGSSVIYDPQMIDGCTIGADIAWTDGASGTPYVLRTPDAASVVPMYDTVVLKGRFYCSPCATNCAFLSSMIGSNLKAENCSNCVWLADVAAAKVGADYRPAADSPLVDAGDAALVDEDYGGADLGGGQRIMNGAIDIGACEFDWRPTYAKVLGRKITVTQVSPSAVSSEEGIVLPAGELSGTVDRAGRCEAVFGITGSGKLSIYLNDELAGEFRAGDTVADLGDVEEGSTFRFCYEPGEGDAGTAVLKRLRVAIGTLLIVR